MPFTIIHTMDCVAIYLLHWSFVGAFASAASSSANIAFWVASSKDHGVISEFNSKHTGSILYAMIDGHSAYCMNFGLSAKGGQLMNSDSNPNTNLSAAQEKLLAPDVLVVPVYLILKTLSDSRSNISAIYFAIASSLPSA